MQLQIRGGGDFSKHGSYWIQYKAFRSSVSPAGSDSVIWKGNDRRDSEEVLEHGRHPTVQVERRRLITQPMTGDTETGSMDNLANSLKEKKNKTNDQQISLKHKNKGLKCTICILWKSRIHSHFPYIRALCYALMYVYPCKLIKPAWLRSFSWPPCVHNI